MASSHTWLAGGSPLAAARGYPHSSQPHLALVPGYHEAVAALASPEWTSPTLLYGNWSVGANRDPYLADVDQDAVAAEARDRYGESCALFVYAAAAIEMRNTILPLLLRGTPLPRAPYIAERPDVSQEPPGEQSFSSEQRHF